MGLFLQDLQEFLRISCAARQDSCKISYSCQKHYLDGSQSRHVSGVLNKNRVIDAKQNFSGNAKNLKSPFVAPLRNILVTSRLLMMQNFA